MATRVCVLDGGGPKDSKNTHNSFSPKRDEDGFWQIGADMVWFVLFQVYHFLICQSSSLSYWEDHTGTQGFKTTLENGAFLCSILFEVNRTFWKMCSI